MTYSGLHYPLCNVGVSSQFLVPHFPPLVIALGAPGSVVRCTLPGPRCTACRGTYRMGYVVLLDPFITLITMHHNNNTTKTQRLDINHRKSSPRGRKSPSSQREPVNKVAAYGTALTELHNGDRVAGPFDRQSKLGVVSAPLKHRQTSPSNGIAVPAHSS